MFKLVFVTLFALSLASCGGGGSDSGSPTPTPGPSTPTPPTPGPAPTPPDNSLVFSPASLSTSIYQGESLQIGLTAKAMRDFPGIVNVAIVEPKGVIKPEIKLEVLSSHEYRATLQSNPGLSPGVYAGSVTVMLCQDDPSVCANPHTGSPWQVPYRFEVKPFAAAGSLTPLVSSGSLNWSVYQGNTAHTGYLPVTIDVSKIAPRFSFRAAGSGRGLAFGDGLGFATIGNDLMAIRELDGVAVWTKSYGEGEMSPPSFYDGKVFVVHSNFSRSELMQLDGKTGGELHWIGVYQPSGYIAPSVDADGIYVKQNGGALAAFDAATLRPSWNLSGRGASQWGIAFTPVLVQDFGYFYNVNAMHKFDRRTGLQVAQIKGSLSDNDDTFSNNAGSPVLLDTDKVLAIEENHRDISTTYSLTAFDFVRQEKMWTKTLQDAEWNPVFANGIIYVVNGGKIEALRSSDGSVLWSWSIPVEELDRTGFSYSDSLTAYNMLVTDNVLIAGFKNNVYAINLTSRQTVWSFPRGGSVSLSPNGVLYINGDAGLHYAFNVR